MIINIARSHGFATQTMSSEIIGRICASSTPHLVRYQDNDGRPPVEGYLYHVPRAFGWIVLGGAGEATFFRISDLDTLEVLE